MTAFTKLPTHITGTLQVVTVGAKATAAITLNATQLQYKNLYVYVEGKKVNAIATAAGAADVPDVTSFLIPADAIYSWARRDNEERIAFYNDAGSGNSEVSVFVSPGT